MQLRKLGRSTLELLRSVDLQLDAEAIAALNTASEWQHS